MFSFMALAEVVTKKLVKYDSKSKQSEQSFRAVDVAKSSVKNVVGKTVIASQRHSAPHTTTLLQHPTFFKD